MRFTTEDDQVMPGLFTVMHAAIGAHKAELDRITQRFWEACRAMKSVGLINNGDDAGGEDREAPR